MGIEADIDDLKDKINQLTDVVNEFKIQTAMLNPKSRYTIRISDSTDSIDLGLRFDTYHCAQNSLGILVDDLRCKKKVQYNRFSSTKDAVLKEIENSSFIKNYSSVQKYIDDYHVLCVQDSFGVRELHIWIIQLSQVKKIQIIPMSDMFNSTMEL